VQKSKHVFLFFFVCLALTLFIHAFVFPQLPNWFNDSFRTFDGMVVPYGLNETGLSLSIFVTFVSLLPVFFLLIVIVHFFTKHRSKLFDYLWTKPTQKVSDCAQNIPQHKVSFFVMSIIISTMTVFTALHTTTDKLLASFADIVGFFDLAGVYHNISVDPSKLASEALIGKFGMFAFLLFGIGPVWLFLIKWAKKEEIRHPGPKILLSYLYALGIILVFVQIGFMTSQPQTESLDKIQTSLSCSSEKDPATILEFTLYGKTRYASHLILQLYL
jgi:hypothetical protein